MKVPRIRGIIRRRLLVNFRIDPDVMAGRLPEPFIPKLYGDHAIAGICLIRLEKIRPAFLPLPVGTTSENAAHRIAVSSGSTPEGGEAVFIPRRDTDSGLNHMLGGRLFQGLYHRARFNVEDDGRDLRLRMTSLDGTASVEVAGRTAEALPGSSIFGSLEEASTFFERGSLGYSVTTVADRFDGMVLETEEWSVQPFEVATVWSSYFEDRARFPLGSVEFDHALVMRDLQHEWRGAPDLCCEARAA